MERKLNGVRRYVYLIFLMCFLSMVGLLATHFALVDIFHGVESDLSMEWNIVRVGFGLQVILIVAVLGLLWRLARISGVHHDE